jgi:hypothetical protein
MINTKCIFNRTIKDRRKKESSKIKGISIYDIETKNKENNPKGYCGSIGLSDNYLTIHTDGKYRYIPKEKALKLFKEILKQSGLIESVKEVIKQERQRENERLDEILNVLVYIENINNKTESDVAIWGLKEKIMEMKNK